MMHLGLLDGLTTVEREGGEHSWVEMKSFLNGLLFAAKKWKREVQVKKTVDDQILAGSRLQYSDGER